MHGKALFSSCCRTGLPPLLSASHLSQKQVCNRDVQLSISAYLAEYTSFTYSVVLASLWLLRTSPEKDQRHSEAWPNCVQTEAANAQSSCEWRNMFSLSREDELGAARVKVSGVSEQKSDMKHLSMQEQQPRGLSSVPTILQVILRMGRTPRHVGKMALQTVFCSHHPSSYLRMSFLTHGFIIVGASILQRIKFPV